jgi:hypothetical protein
MDLVGGNKPVEVPDAEDSSTIEDVGNGAYHESAAEGCDTLVESTDPDP